MNSTRFIDSVVLLAVSAVLNCSDNNNPVATYPTVNRRDKIPSDISKRGPESDQHPPILHSDHYAAPISLSSAVNSAGAEDSPFILPDGKTLYFFFTPDVRVPVEKQLLDEVTGVWVSHKTGDQWSDAERVWLQEPGKLALDGAVCVQDDEMWFASAREGYTGVNMFIARWVNGKWSNWRYAGDRLMREIQIGEVHIHKDDLYFHSERSGGKGGYDIWLTTRNADSWSDPIHIDAVNSGTMDGYPFVSADGNELWLTRTYAGTPAIFRSLRIDRHWSAPELIVSQFAGEPTLDAAGTLYFVHHYFEDGVMIEADIYVAYERNVD
ncbi:hypothetical protein EH222_01065 [candidate division KSB1 bacterium]|nr:MAG: hypothetical protein EH222_01065 [candidate division KSB1 bacterium]